MRNRVYKVNNKRQNKIRYMMNYVKQRDLKSPQKGLFRSTDCCLIFKAYI